MSTITKEFTKEQLQQIEAAAKEVLWPVVWSEKKAREHFSEKITPKVVLKLARIALASLEAEPVAYVDPFSFHNFSVYRAGETDNRRMGREWMWANPDAGLIPVYTAPPAPVSVPKDIPDSVFEVLCQASGSGGKACDFADELWNACRAAMLQGADQPQSAQQNIPENIPTLREAVDTIRSSGIAIDAEKIFAERDALNSPVIPDGCALVPIEPTEHMIVEGFESEPDEYFSDEEVWEAYDAMSGCQQAAHRAKLCWAAMIEAAPKLE